MVNTSSNRSNPGLSNPLDSLPQFKPNNNGLQQLPQLPQQQQHYVNNSVLKGGNSIHISHRSHRSSGESERFNQEEGGFD